MEKNKVKIGADNQSEVTKVWSDSWTETKANKRSITNRYFIESYPIFKKFIPPKIVKILEIATGTGRYGISMAKDFPESEVYLTDISEESLDLAKRLAEDMNIKNVVFKKEDILNLSYDDNSFDLVVNEGIVHMCPDANKAIAEILRVLRPGGIMITAVANYWNFHTLYKLFLKIIGKKFEYGYEYHFRRKELREIVQKNNFEVIGEDGFYVGYGLYRLKKYYNIFDILGRIVNRTSKILDKYTNRFFTKNFGFYLVIVGKKKK